MFTAVGALVAGGIAGTLCRAGANAALPGRSTLLVNLAGCFLVGLFDAALAKRGVGGERGRALLMTGFCGAFTTFSTLVLEFDALLRASPARAALYLGVSVAAGLLLLRAGLALGRA